MSDLLKMEQVLMNWNSSIFFCKTSLSLESPQNSSEILSFMFAALFHAVSAKEQNIQEKLYR